MEIFFFGLMCLVGATRGGPRTFAVVVASGVHRPVLVVDGKVTLLQAGDMITFDTGQGNAGPAGIFDTAVPHLQDLTKKNGANANLLPDILAMTNKNEALAYVKLPAGDLSVAETYDVQADFNPPDTRGKESCVAKLVVLKPTTVAKSVTLTRNGTPKLFSITNWVLIANLSLGRPGVPKFHFHEYKKITDATDIGTLRPRLDDCRAPVTATANGGAVDVVINSEMAALREARAARTRRVRGKMHPFAPTQVECAPSQFP